eukprot:CAMPEP_0115290914 /NCGR_PEP_ID=MMETSP0270-20121206/64315_1 /TAXON_ID=71861 /ORGANISM="Scrippsiella trochoidea, Strain CCMP3099" /LENGTH=49 /DNA_ID= /DNA_START= /DNA_END= /DNA_ORIENTATION=
MAVHRHQGGLHGDALGLPKGGKGLGDPANEPMDVLERVPGRQGVVTWTC